MKVFKVKVGKMAGYGSSCILRYNGDYYILVKKVECADGKIKYIDEKIELTDLYWDKSNPKQLVGYYTASWLGVDGEPIVQERVITIEEELKLEIGL